MEKRLELVKGIYLFNIVHVILLHTVTVKELTDSKRELEELFITLNEQLMEREETMQQLQKHNEQLQLVIKYNEGMSLLYYLYIFDTLVEEYIAVQKDKGAYVHIHS